MRTRCKICGIKTLEAARAAVDAGADAIGLVFHPSSPRAVTVDQAVQIRRALPAFVSAVGLFVNPAAGVVESVLERVRLDMLQFHGDEDNIQCASFGVPFIKALGVTAAFDARLAEEHYPDAAALLLDTHDPILRGGTGRTFDWSWFPAPSSHPLILAGGLTPDNVREAIRRCRPYAVDVSGGVEVQRGEKSIPLIKAFVHEVMHEHEA